MINNIYPSAVFFKLFWFMAPFVFQKFSTASNSKCKPTVDLVPVSSAFTLLYDLFLILHGFLGILLKLLYYTKLLTLPFKILIQMWLNILSYTNSLIPVVSNLALNVKVHYWKYFILIEKQLAPNWSLKIIF